MYRPAVIWVGLAAGLLLGPTLLGGTASEPFGNLTALSTAEGQPPSVADLIGRLDNPETSDQAADELGERGTKAVPELLAALETGSEARRALLVGILGRIGDPEARPALERCLTDGSPAVRRAAAVALGRLGQRDASKALVGALSDPDGEVRAYAALSLGELRDGAALGALVRALGDDVEQARDYAAVALGNLQDAQAGPALLWLLTQDPSPYVRAHAADALATLGVKGACGRLVDALDDQSDLVRLRAYRALVSLSGKNFPFSARTSGLVRREQVARWREWYQSARGSLTEVQPLAPKELAQKLTPPAPPTVPSPAAPTPPAGTPASAGPEPAAPQSAVPPPGPSQSAAQQPAVPSLPQPAPAPETPRPAAPPPAPTQAPAQKPTGATGLAPATPPPPAKVLTPALARKGGPSSQPPNPIPAGAEVAFATGTSALSRGDWAAARQSLSEAVAAAPQWADAYYNLAVAHVKLNDWPEAAKALRQATALEPNQGDAWALLGVVLWMTGELGEAYAALERAAALPGASATTLLNVAGLALELGEYETSAEWFAALGERGFQELPAQVQGEAHLRAAVAFYRAGALARALAHLESAQKLDLASPWLEVYLGHVLWASGASEQAIDHYRRALVAGVRDREALTNLADGLLAQGGQSEAEMVLKELLASDPADGESWLRLGLCLLRQQRSSEAREALGRALKTRLDDESARRALSRAARTEADVQAVVEEFRRLVGEHPDDPETHYYLGLALAQSGKNEEAEEHLRAASELASADARYRAALAGLLLGTGRTGEALSLAEALVREAPRVARSQALLAEAYFRTGRPGDAVQAIDRALLLEPGNRAYGEKRLQYLGGATEPKRTEPPSAERAAPERSPTTPTEPGKPGPP